MLSAVRVELLNPRAQRPGYQYILQRLSGNIQSALNHLNSNGRAWAVANTILTVSSGTGDYTLNAANAGKILDVNTYNPSDPNWIERQITFFDYADMTHHWDKVRDAASWVWTPDGGPHTAQRMAFYRQGGSEQLYVKILPIPQTSAQYRISYAIRNLGGVDTALTVEPLLSNFHDLLIQETALDSLPACVWDDDEKANQQMRENLARSLAQRISQLRPQFMCYVSSLTTPRNTTRVCQFSIDQ